MVNQIQKINKGNKLRISDVVISSIDTYHLHGNILIVNGMNGNTQVSRQSLKHIMDIIVYLEEYYGARAYISYVSSHSDVYYYMISFIIWDGYETNSGYLKPLYHEE